MAELKKTYCICFGEDWVKTIPWKEKRNLNNEKLTRYMANKFISFLLKNKKIKHTIKTTFSTKKEYDPITRQVYWGYTYTHTRNIILYRQSVWIFLHELAHACAPINSFHDQKFANQLQRLHGHWKKFKRGNRGTNGKDKK
jgi:hypothetical protein